MRTRHVEVITAALMVFSIPLKIDAQTGTQLPPLSSSPSTQETQNFLSTLPEEDTEAANAALYDICTNDADTTYKKCLDDNEKEKHITNPAIINDPVAVDLAKCATRVLCQSEHKEALLECGCILPTNQITPYCLSYESNRLERCLLEADSVTTICLQCERLSKRECREASNQAVKECKDAILPPPPPPLTPLA